MSHQVFISYSNEKGESATSDSQVAESIYSVLQSQNIGCWLAPKNIRAGDEWPKELAAALEQANVVVLVFSANAQRSKWVTREINYANDKNKIIIVFMIENVSPQGIYAILKSSLQWMDACTPPLQVHLDKLATAVKGHLNIPPVPQPRGMLSNPFIESRAIQEPARFIGREAELHRLLNLLQGGSVSLQGEPRMGKSSLMWHLSRNWQGKVIGPLNCQTLQDREDFFEQLSKALELDNHDWKTIRQMLNKSNVLFLMDELDVAPGKGVTHSDLALFSAICDENRDFKMVAISRTPLHKVFPDTGRGSLAFRFLVPFTVGPFSEAEARQLLAHPWMPDAPLFDDKTCDELVALTGCYPYKLQRAAYHRFEWLADPAYDWQVRYRLEMEQIV